jgi:hypothetical protein
VTIIKQLNWARSGSEFFKVATADQLDRGLLAAVATRQLGAVHLKGLIKAPECSAVLDAVEARRLKAFDISRYHVPTFHLGPILNHCLPGLELPEHYWTEAGQAEEFWRGCRPDLRALCLELFADAWGSPVGRMYHGGRPLFSGIIRDNSYGAPLHWDDLAIEFPPGFVSPEIIAQFSFVLYLEMPAAGGDTDIWPRRWVPSDDRYRVGSCWPALPLEDPSLTVRAATGDAIVFDPRHYHQVRPSTTGRRMTFASYFGIACDGSLVAWS